MNLTEGTIVDIKVVSEDGKDLANVAPQNTEIAPRTESGALLQMAIDKDLDINKLEKLIDLKVREEERYCKKDFDLHFSKMQKQYKAATKTGEVFNKEGSKRLYKFCSLEDILKVYAPVIAKHGFSFKWKEEMVSDKIKRISCIISGYGHEEIGSVEIPISEGNSFTNSIQQRGVATSYGKRYSFINSFGVIIEDEDNDAVTLTFDEGVQYSEQVVAINSCNNKEDLIKTWKAIWTAFADDPSGREVLHHIYNQKKQELSK